MSTNPTCSCAQHAPPPTPWQYGALCAALLFAGALAFCGWPTGDGRLIGSGISAVLALVILFVDLTRPGRTASTTDFLAVTLAVLVAGMASTDLAEGVSNGWIYALLGVALALFVMCLLYRRRESLGATFLAYVALCFDAVLAVLLIVAIALP